MSGLFGGGSQTVTQKSDPWSAAQPYLKDIMGQAQELYLTGGPQMYPGQTFVGPTSGQIGSWDTALTYADQVFGGQSAPKFGQATNALGNALAGNTTLGGMAGDISSIAVPALTQGFAGGAPTFNPSAFTPSLGNIGGLDTTGAFSKALSGTPDYSGLQGAIDAANAPILRQFEQDILPGLNQRATFLGNPTGGIKTLNKVLPELGERMSLNAQTLTEAERQRALGAQQGAAQYLTGAGLQATGLGQQGASTAAGILGDYRNQLLGLGGLSGQLAQGAGSQTLQGLGLFPSIATAGQYPGQLAGQFADWGAGFQNQALQDQINQFNYYQNLPWQNLNNYNATVQGYGGLGGTQSQTQPSGSPLLGALGGAATGLGAMGTLASITGGSVPALGALTGLLGPAGGAAASWGGAGALLGLLSDRRAKEDIVRVGTLESGLPIYRFRYRGNPVIQIGVMADEVREKFPEAVTRAADGLDRVNYAMVH